MMHAWQAELRDRNDQYLSGRQGVEIYCATVRRGHQGTPIKLTCSSEFFHPALIIEESIEVSFFVSDSFSSTQRCSDAEKHNSPQQG